jgi:hypothetical protein
LIDKSRWVGEIDGVEHRQSDGKRGLLRSVVVDCSESIAGARKGGREAQVPVQVHTK